MKKGLISVLSGTIGIAAGIVAGAVITKQTNSEEKEQWKKLSDKHLELFLMMNQWVRVKQSGNSIACYLERNGYRKIAVYGISYVGETLLKELEGTQIEVAYGIDQNAEGICADIGLVAPGSCFDQVDAIIVTAIFHYDEIKETLRTKINCPILSLKEILYQW